MLREIRLLKELRMYICITLDSILVKHIVERLEHGRDMGIVIRAQVAHELRQQVSPITREISGGNDS